jgi:hypothetical protein
MYSKICTYIVTGVQQVLAALTSLDCIGRRSSVRAGYIPMFAAGAAGCALPEALKAEAHGVVK